MTGNPRSPGDPTILRMLFRALASLIVILVMLIGLLFLPAGRLDWPDAWLFIAAYAALLVTYAVWLLVKDPELLKERSRVAANTKPWDRVILTAYTVFLLATLVVTGLDAGRFHWSDVPAAVHGIAWIGLVASGALILSAVTANTYLSRTARIQEDREQVVVTRGPYGIVRHPMYLGVILLFTCVPPALGSLWAMIPGLIVGLLFVVRTAKEDKMLQEELPGYASYSGRVRYRLLPGIW
jgi:protein-S-isoprenylcysteine O-methyltransferase Ste14